MPAVAEPEAARLVCFFVDDQELGVDIADVRETIEPRPVTRVFLVPDFVAGLMNLRGDVLAVIDLARLLGFRGTAPGAARVVIVRARIAGRLVSAGLLVDRLADVRDLAPGSLRPPPPTLPGSVGGLLRGVARAGDHPLLVLDVERLLDHERLRPYRRRA